MAKPLPTKTSLRLRFWQRVAEFALERAGIKVREPKPRLPGAYHVRAAESRTRPPWGPDHPSYDEMGQ